MKECKYCNSKYENGLKECPNCGGTAVVTEAERQLVVEQEKYPDNSKKLRALILTGAGLIIIAIISVVIAISAAKNRTYENDMTRGEINTAIELGQSYLEQGEYQAAIMEFQKVPPDFNGYDRVQEMISEAEEGYANQLLERADDLLSRGDFSGALALFKAEAAFFNAHPRLAAKRNETLDRYKDDFLNRADGLLQAGDFSGALSLLDSATNLFGNDTAISTKKNEVSEAYKADFLERASGFLSAGSHSEALSVLETAQGIFGNDSDISAKIIEVNKARILERITEFEQSGDLAGVILFLDAELPSVNNDATITERLNLFTIQYRESIISEAAAVFDTDGYEAAIRVLNSGLSILSRDSTFLDLISDYEEYAPVPLVNIDHFTGRNLIVNSTERDNLGDEHHSVVVYGTYQQGGRQIDNVYRIGGQYSRISGTVFMLYDYRSQQTGVTLEIHGDGRLIYTTSVAGGTEPTNFNIDITGVLELRIKTSDFNYKFGAEMGCFGISDLHLYRK